MDRDALAVEALQQYELYQPQLELIRHNENLTYLVTDSQSHNRFLLRVHKPIEGFSLDFVQHGYEALEAELEFLRAIRESTDICVQRPVQTRAGTLICHIEDPLRANPLYATMLTWIDGQPMSHEDPEWEHQAYLTGVMTAKLHNFAAQWHPDFAAKRRRYDQRELDKIVEAIGAGVNIGLFSTAQYQVIQEGAKRILELMDELSNRPSSFGLIHADLARTNLIVCGETVTPIDFALSGCGYFLQDLGDLSADFGPLHIRQAMLAGYSTIRCLSDADLKYIEAFFVSAILHFMAIHLHNRRRHEWFGRRVPVICEKYIRPLVQDKRFYEDI